MKRQTFTLVELLTVIAIIGILSAILIPTVGKARATAQRTTCLNNYKQLGVAVISFRADNKGEMPSAKQGSQILYNPLTTNTYNVRKKNGNVVGILDYAYINSFKIIKGPDDSGACQVSKDKKHNGDVWICPNVIRWFQSKESTSDERGRIGIMPAIANYSPYTYAFFSSDPEKPTHIPTNAPVSLDRCPMLAEICANSAMNGATGDPQGGYRVKSSIRQGQYKFPPPHDGTYTVNWMDGHVEVCPAEKNRFLNWQPLDEKDKYYAPYGSRAQASNPD